VIGGVVVQGNQAEDREVAVTITPLISGAYATISLEVVVGSAISVAQLQNQALVSILDAEGQPSGQAPLVSDDPDTAMPNDPTLTPLMEPAASPGSPIFLPLIQKQ
jgi:hypothetical protein